MPTESMEGSRLRIHQLQVNCLVPSDHPRPERVSQRVADIAEHNLSQALNLALTPTFAAADPSIWFIKRLDFVIDVNVGWDPDELAHNFAKQMVQGLVKRLSE